MGYMTVISILNDGWQAIRENPTEFIEKIEKGMTCSSKRKTIENYAIGNYCAPLSVHLSQHADVPQLLLAHRNSFIDLNNISEIKDSLNDLKYQQQQLDLAQNLIKTAKENIYDVVGKRISNKLKEDNKNLKNIEISELMEYIKKDEWVKELNLCNKKFAAYLKKYYYFIS